jgi:hypothetical protein
MASPNFQQVLSELNIFELYHLLNSALNSREEKAPLVQSIQKHLTTMNQKKEPTLRVQKPRNTTQPVTPAKSSSGEQSSIPVLTPSSLLITSQLAPPTHNGASKIPLSPTSVMQPPLPVVFPVQQFSYQAQCVTLMPAQCVLQVQGPPRHMNLVHVNAPHPPRPRNDPPVLVHPLQYLQHRDKCWNNYRKWKRKQMSEATPVRQQQMFVAHAAVPLHHHHQQQQGQTFRKRFRFNNGPCPIVVTHDAATKQGLANRFPSNNVSYHMVKVHAAAMQNQLQQQPQK